MKRRHFLNLLGISSAGAACATVAEDAIPAEEASSDDLTTAETFEYIIVGSGAGGGPLACNLARNGHKVLLLEAGDDRGNNTDYQVPAFHALSTEDPTMRWDYFVRHWDDETQQKRDPKLTAGAGPAGAGGVSYPRAGTLGGCTAHNAMITVYPHAADWDGMAQLTGDASWSSANMRKYFQVLENCQYLGDFDDTQGHGFKGWLTTSRADSGIALKDGKLLKIVSAAASAFTRSDGGWGLGQLIGDIKEIIGTLKRDLNTAASGRDQAEGLYGIPLAVDNGHRNGPREYILRTVKNKAPLTVRTGALCSRVIFGDKVGADGRWQATGIEYLEGQHLYRADPGAPASGAGGKLVKVKASREVILCAGAFNTPQLLKLSGIGPKAELAQFAIPLKVDLPGVGGNLQDRYEVGVVTKWSSDFSAIDGCTFGQKGDPCLADWQKNPSAVYSTNGVVLGIVKKSRPDKPVPDLFVFGAPGDFRGYKPGYSKQAVADHRHFTWAVLKAHTGNRKGVVKLKSKDPRDVPDIRFRYFEEGSNNAGEASADLAAVVAGVKLAREINVKAGHLALFDSVEEVGPGPSVQSDAQIAQFVRNEAWGHHASCTCPIGPDGDANAVLDAKFRVRGTSGLRVVDASVFPKIPGFFIVTPIYMASEKATDDVLAAIGEQRKF